MLYGTHNHEVLSLFVFNSQREIDVENVFSLKAAIRQRAAWRPQNYWLLTQWTTELLAIELEIRRVWQQPWGYPSGWVSTHQTKLKNGPFWDNFYPPTFPPSLPPSIPPPPQPNLSIYHIISPHLIILFDKHFIANGRFHVRTISCASQTIVSTS